MSSETREFWEYLSEYYKNYPMIGHDANYEMNYLLSEISSLTSQISNLICLGVADGSRDPVAILDWLKSQSKSLPERMTLLDISARLIDLCRQRVIDSGFGSIPTVYVSKPIHEVDHLPVSGGTLYLGIYNADFIEESLSVYVSNQKEMGQHFELSWLSWNGDVVTPNNDLIYFDINDYKNVIPEILALREREGFLAYSIITEKDFVTHHYDQKTVTRLLKAVFGEEKTGVVSAGHRHIMGRIQLGSLNSSPSIVTMLNNVLGNIPATLQLESLSTIKRWFQ